MNFHNSNPTINPFAITGIKAAKQSCFRNIIPKHEIKVAKADQIMQEIVKKLRRHEGITTANYQGINQIENSSIDYQFVITCDPSNKLQIRRDALHIIIETLEKNKIEIPHNKIDIYDRK